MKVLSIVHLRHSFIQVKPRHIIGTFGALSRDRFHSNTNSFDIVSDELHTANQINKVGGKVYHNGGLTRVVVEIDGKQSIGESQCNLSDRFNRRKGIAIALGRAKKNLTSES